MIFGGDPTKLGIQCCVPWVEGIPLGAPLLLCAVRNYSGSDISPQSETTCHKTGILIKIEIQILLKI